MSSLPRLRDLNPLRILQNNISYQRLPTSGNVASSSRTPSREGSPSTTARRIPKWERWRCNTRLSTNRLIMLAIAAVVVISLTGGGGYHTVQRVKAKGQQGDDDEPFFWQKFRRLNAYYGGIRLMVPYAEYEEENRYNVTDQPVPPTKEQIAALPKEPPIKPERFDPYPDYKSAEYLKDHHAVSECFIDEEEKVTVPDVHAYPGVPQYMPKPFYGSHTELGMREDVCFERFGRLAPYGYGFNESMGGDGAGQKTEANGSEEIYESSAYVNYTKVDWGAAQKRCYEKNKARFEEDKTGGKERVKRHAYVLRTWTGYEYSEHVMFTLRAMIAELALKTGGEYDVHFLVHVKDDSLPIWADDGMYQHVLQENVPEEFWGISTLWSEQQMKMYYPDPFPNNFVNMAASSIHGVYRSAHFGLQWFGQQHPEYDFFWNWEMDLRYSGHYFEFNDRIGNWARQQPRKGLWERSKRFWFPAHHGSYADFTQQVERETANEDAAKHDPVKNGPLPIWGPVQDFPNQGMLPPPPDTIPPHPYAQDNYTWGVGEDSDLLTFNPIFDTATTNWVFRDDVTGYDRASPIPPRRAAIITVARLSRRLMDAMHEETWRMRHHMFPEMWPPSVALHHGLKAVYVPHPVYFDRDWDLDYMDQVFNHPKEIHESTFGWGEHNMLGSSFYYNSGFSGALWRRWLGFRENGEGGMKDEERGSGRMCLRPTLHHPIKYEDDRRKNGG